ncbi:hypothetical protein [Geomonas propionica]|uniref:Uncharacterized protein n=1 Tax=Geomonas propionica TaxID=2798582 RepID=A0ABS0YSL9_9BACT|nr:hypothetical protein [Geomonas propionica]MBJ6800968.1 hypothetical protein [Geomonas propionica]
MTGSSKICEVCYYWETLLIVQALLYLARRRWPTARLKRGSKKGAADNARHKKSPMMWIIELFPKK